MRLCGEKDMKIPSVSKAVIFHVSLVFKKSGSDPHGAVFFLPGKKSSRVFFRGRTLPVLARLLSELSARDIFAGQPQAATAGCSGQCSPSRVRCCPSCSAELLTERTFRSPSGLNQLMVKAEPSLGLAELLQEALQSITCAARPGFNTFSVASSWLCDPVTCCQSRNWYFPCSACPPAIRWTILQ